MSRLCPGLPDFAALSRNPARLHKWRCGTSINSVYYRISVRISRCLVGVAVHNRPKVGVVSPKWAWPVKFRARFARINYIFYSVPVSLLVSLATMIIVTLNLLQVHLPVILRPRRVSRLNIIRFCSQGLKPSLLFTLSSHLLR